MQDLTSITLDELLAEDAYYFLKDKLRKMRASKGHCILELRVTDGYISTYGIKETFKVSRMKTRVN
jgi:hypothetical protein